MKLEDFELHGMKVVSGVSCGYTDECIDVIVLAKTSKRKLDTHSRYARDMDENGPNGPDHDNFYGVAEKLARGIRDASIKLDPQTDIQKTEVIEKFKNAFSKAGFSLIYVEETPNEYCSDSCCINKPWLIVTTEVGRIKIGWRKRVINIDWSDSDVSADGDELFKEEDTTVWSTGIHAWSYDKAAEYLKTLRESQCNTK